MNFYSSFAYLEDNRLKYGTVVLHTVLLSNCEFHENRCSGSHTLLNGVYMYFIRIFYVCTQIRINLGTRDDT